MNDEIKEILDYFKRNDKNKFDFNQAKILNDEEAKLLLDYITNLQESEAYYYGQYKDYKSRIEKADEYIKEQFSKMEYKVGE